MKLFFVVAAVLLVCAASGQRQPDQVFMPSIKTVKLFKQNNQESLPVIRLNSADLMELHFDDMDGYVKNYYYSFELCNADWQPADISTFDYIRGFPQMRLTEYRTSSVTLSKYVHYHALLPENNSVPTKSGNYLLKVFLDGDTSQLAFTRRFFVVDNRMALSIQVQQPFDNQLFHTHQKVQLSVNTGDISLYNPQQQLKVAVIQNNRWDNAVTNIQPSFIRNNVLEYNGEQDVVFPAGREYRWADLRSFRFLSDRIAGSDNNTPAKITMKPDLVRRQQAYLFVKDLNGAYIVSTTESVNPWWQTDYAEVHFTFAPDNQQPYAGKDVYMIGEITGNQQTPEAKMQYNADKGVYEKTLLLKQGYYSYIYVTVDNNTDGSRPDPSLTEGNYWETENNYTVFVYYRSISDRSDELVALTTINSRSGAAGR